jgi:hypothetical protein
MKKYNYLLYIFAVAFISAAMLFVSDEAFAWSSSYSSSGGGWGGSSGSSSGSSSSGWGGGSDGGWGGGSGSLTEEDCRLCHENLDRFPQLEDINPDKHHLLVGLEIPKSTVAPFGFPGELYECTSCHAVEQTDDMNFQIEVIRDCLQCHPIETVTGSPRSQNVHHRTQTFFQGRCNACHSVIGWGGGW